jgi:predicted HAD superfamily Cof-like phosphohydrolase
MMSFNIEADIFFTTMKDNMTTEATITTKQYPSPYVLVHEFHTTYGQAVRTVPILDVPEKDMRVDLIREEAKEYRDAFEAGDFVEIVDALADILYVVYGAGITHGIDIDAIRAHLVGPSVLFASAVPVLDAPGALEVLINVEARVAEYVAAVEAGNIIFVGLALAEIVDAVYHAAAVHGVDVDDVLEEVQRSNLSKLEDGKVLLREDGKVLKGKYFFTPDVVRVLRGQGWNN